MESTYHPPTALTVLAGIFLALGAVFLIIVASDIVLRKGWRSMMWIMIPVYIINAAYMGPLTLYIYLKHGRPPKPTSDSTTSGQHHDSHAEKEVESGSDTTQPESHCHSHDETSVKPQEQGTSHCHNHKKQRPMLATVLVGVSHCGAGCVLGDIVGEWLVYGTQAKINGQMIWVELLVDYAFALLFGIVFQYFSIAPMSGEYGPKSLWRAAKADILSLTSFEVGAFGWMVAFQVGIWDYRLTTDTWTYWWMMQVGMVLGFCTAMPVNWFLITKKIKEPCA